MNRTSWTLTALLTGLWPLASVAQETTAVSARYKALKCPSASCESTWSILDRDGANREVTPYLSSLGHGETGTGVITSPPFVIVADKITFTICGHDGQAGGQDENYVALVDARKGNVLLKTAPPQNDAMQQREWDVKGLGGVEVRIELHDGNEGGGFAWLGVGQINAGEALRVDFKDGMPKGWGQSRQEEEVYCETIVGTVPFKRDANAFTLIPKEGAVEIPCGFTADQLFFLGCTVNGFKPLETHGGIEIHYADGSPDVFPLMCGFTLDGRYKLLSPAKAMHLHVSADAYQHYLVIQPRKDTITKIRLVAQPDRYPIPRITAITCETSATSERLMPLPKAREDADETAWIQSHALTADTPDLARIMAEIRKAHGISTAGADTTVRFRKHQIDKAFRSEGVAVADFNGDGRLDIAVGSVYYAGPDWQPVPILSEAKEFNRYGYSDSFLCFADDLNRDEAVDLIVVGFPGQQTHWFANPGEPGSPWKKHLAVKQTGNESPTYTDIDGDGRRELICINNGKCVLARPGDDPTQPWELHAISNDGEPAPGHGLGVGDINKDGVLDVLIPDGWWQGTREPSESPWRFHATSFFGGAQLCVHDFDGDGDSDVLGSSPHAYGIAWSEQTPDGWKTHKIDDTMSQTHAIHLADINGDGLMDFVTGKRFWAHNGHDPGSFQPAVLCWFEQQRRDGRTVWEKQVIDVTSGVGLHFNIVDINKDGRPDIVTANKKGVHYFEQLGT
ncbi:MAG TPA: FG-GAP-like repeat-containing protein [Hyphomicrobiaceae bacterium]|nr:FG-GAP-like repeat-containing protein [Hyphomicrobiaceae bacterium]